MWQAKAARHSSVTFADIRHTQWRLRASRCEALDVMMTLRLIAPWASFDQRIRGLQAALQVLGDAGLDALIAESAFHQLMRANAQGVFDDHSPAMVRAAVVWRRALEAAAQHCKGAQLVDARAEDGIAVAHPPGQGTSDVLDHCEDATPST